MAIAPEAARAARPAARTDAVFVSWARENGRTTDLARRLGVPARFIRDGGGFLLARYAAQFRDTLHELAGLRPSTVLLMLPPTPLLLAVLLHARRAGTRVVADLHTGQFNDPKWSWSAGLALRLLRRHTVVVTNEDLAERCRRAGVASVLVLHDPLEHREAPQPQHQRPRLVCPVSYANDEPIDAMLEAARRTPEVDWVLTGRAPAAVRDAAPANVRLAGWLDDEAFDGLLGDADLVVALTTRPFTMQRAGYEAMMRGKPVVTSDFAVLREFFEDAAVYVRPEDASSITAGVRAAAERLPALREATGRVLRARIGEQDAALQRLRDLVRPAGG